MENAMSVTKFISRRSLSTSSTVSSLRRRRPSTNNGSGSGSTSNINVPFPTHLSSATTKYRDEKNSASTDSSTSSSLLKSRNSNSTKGTFLNFVDEKEAERRAHSLGGRLHRQPSKHKSQHDILSSKVHTYDLASIGGRLVRFKNNDEKKNDVDNENDSRVDSNTNNDDEISPKKSSTDKSRASLAVTMSATARYRLKRQNLNTTTSKIKNPSLLSISQSTEESQLENEGQEQLLESKNLHDDNVDGTNTSAEKSGSGNFIRNGVATILVGGSITGAIITPGIIPTF